MRAFPLLLPAPHAAPAFRVLALAIACGACLLLAGCTGYPRDPEGTSDRVRGGVLRVGLSDDPPFTTMTGAGPAGRETELVRRFARHAQARVAWRQGGHDALMRSLQRRELDMVIGGYDKDSPWNEHVATSRAYDVRDAHGRLARRVAAMPPGENAWLMRFDRFSRSAAARGALEGQAP